MRNRRLGPAERPNLGQPTAPRPAASVVLLRPAVASGLEVLLVRRSERAAFMPGTWVFPGGAVDPCDGSAEAAHRACAVRELAEEAAIELSEDHELILFSRWITPEVVTRRFDARFFLALAPPRAAPRPDGSETTEADWFQPAAAIEAAETGTIALSFPTVTQLRSLLPYTAAEAAIAAFRGVPVDPILPVVLGDEVEHHVVLPGEPGYPD